MKKRRWLLVLAVLVMLMPELLLPVSGLCTHIHEEDCYNVSGDIRCDLPQVEDCSQIHIHVPQSGPVMQTEESERLPEKHQGFTWAGLLSGLGGLLILQRKNCHFCRCC